MNARVRLLLAAFVTAAAAFTWTAGQPTIAQATEPTPEPAPTASATLDELLKARSGELQATATQVQLQLREQRLLDAKTGVVQASGFDSEKVATWTASDDPPPFSREPAGGTQPVAVRAARVAHQLFGDVIAGYGGQSNRGGECSYSDHCTGLAVDLMLTGDSFHYTTDAGRAAGWVIAEFFAHHAAELDVKYIIFDDHAWYVHRGDTPEMRRDAWHPYTSPRGGNSDTNQHRDHVHISFNTGTSVTPG